MNDCLDSVAGNYKTRLAYSYDDLYQLIRMNGNTAYNFTGKEVDEETGLYYYDARYLDPKYS